MKPSTMKWVHLFVAAIGVTVVATAVSMIRSQGLGTALGIQLAAGIGMIIFGLMSAYSVSSGEANEQETELE
ncbi:MAG: hypothetical protein ABEK59_01595 [Halobacteria archaeon]